MSSTEDLRSGNGGLAMRLRTRSELHLRPLQAFAIVGLAVFAAAMIGIVSRPMNLSASFWPANALLLGLMVRVPEYRAPRYWVAAIIGYMLADLTQGTALHYSVWLTSANLVFVATGLLLFRWVNPADIRLMRPNSIFYVFGVCIVAGGVTGTFALLIDTPWDFGGTFETWKFWSAAEMANAMAMLPVVLACPPLDRDLLRRFTQHRSGERFRALEPVLILLVAVGIGVLVGGASAAALPIPALLWCALRTSVFETTLLTMIVNVWTVVMVASGRIDLVGIAEGSAELASVHIALSLAAVGPIAVACTMTTRQRELLHLKRAASRDALTGAMARGAFFEDSLRGFEDLAADRRSVGVIVIDVDDFKAINDGSGHPAGDRVLAGISTVILAKLRDNDNFGRIGGDEFAIMLPGITEDTLQTLAERLRDAVVRWSDESGDDPPPVTISVGTAFANAAESDFELLLAEADAAMYRAKRGGRNRVAPRLVAQSTSGQRSSAS